MPSFSKLSALIVRIAAMVIPPLMKIIDKLVPIFVKLLDPIMKLVSKLLPPLMRLFDALLPILEMVFDWIGFLADVIGKIVDVIGDGLTPIIDGLTNAFKFLQTMLKPVWDLIKPLLDGLLALMGVKVEPEVKTKVDTSATDNLDLTGSAAGLTGTPSTTGGATGGKTKDENLTKYLDQTNKSILKAQKDYQLAITKANDDYAKDVQKQVDDFRGAFASSTATSISDIYKQGYQSADSMAQALKDRLASIQNLSQDAAKLSAAGYSAEFIKEVMAQGPQMGDQMTKSLLAGTPEQQKQIQDLLAQTQEASNTGVDDVANGLRSQFTDGTDKLNSALKAAHKTLDTTLGTIQKGLNTKLAGFGGNLKTYAKQLAATNSLITGTKTGAGKTGTAAQAQAAAGQGVGQHINTTVNVQTNATPQMIAQQTVSAIKFGIPATAGVNI